MKNLKRTLSFAFLLSFLCFGTLSAQDKYVTDISEVHFFSSTPVEDIEAENSALKGVIDTETNDFSFRIPIKSFVFEKALMQEHFNENYMESDKYPNAAFKGNIRGDYSLVENGIYAVEAIGTFEIHGVSQERSIPATIVVENGFPSIQCSFQVALVDHKIKVPKIVFYNIAEKIDVKVDAGLRLY